jgi:hypothetical protein
MSKWIYIEWPVSRGLISARVPPPLPIGGTAVQRPSQVENYSRQGAFSCFENISQYLMLIRIWLIIFNINTGSNEQILISKVQLYS